MIYNQHLQLAIETARSAGALLRAEFHRPNGPRGHGEKAPIDAETEECIRNALGSAYPSYGYRGEELGESKRPGDRGEHLWLVDPNDGTSTFLPGYRGSAVSIALLRAGEPVLGVVYAFAAPDDNGDLLAWAEGCGPLTRNGQPVTHALPRSLTPDSTVLLSASADMTPTANAEAVAPARFRALPSIAYRLALVAAGEGTATVCVSAPRGWDYAAGHALLLGAGGALLDAQGEPVRYTVDGESDCSGACFGGAAEVAAELAQRDWAAVLAGPELADERYPPAKPPAPGRAIANNAVLARAQGCLLGQLAGDSLGGLVEFQPPARIAQMYPNGMRKLIDGGVWDTLAGQPTDDSELALLLARTLVREQRFEPEAVARAYAWWYDSDPFDVGETTSTALWAAMAAAENGEPVAAAAHAAADTTSESNGALMRISPLGIFGWRAAPDRLARWARADARLTHPHRICQDAGAVFTVTVAWAIANNPSPEATFRFAVDWVRTHKLRPKVGQAVQAARVEPPPDYLREPGWVLIALQNAFYQLLHADTLAAGVIDTVRRGGDTDTNAAIAGALLGAVHGRAAIPQQWQDRILTCRPIEELPDVEHPRPQPLWPVDCLLLAEQLLICGASL
ncbi:MAG: ADP-ribosylglycohydrolase family protein [Kiritimatiellae bacterium]|nr:ADP-ribosylglycohydrolase family protein [Kiritimatiellia bacterium]